jgi:putative protease
MNLLFDLWKRLINRFKKKKKTRHKIRKKTVRKPRKKTQKKTGKKPQKKAQNKIGKKPKKTPPRKIAKKPVKKTSKKPAKSTQPKKIKRPSKAVKKTPKKPKEKEIGVITHYFGKISVGIIKLKGALNVGDKIHVKGAHDNFIQGIESMQYNHKDILSGKKGMEIGIRVSKPVHVNDKVYQIL